MQKSMSKLEQFTRQFLSSTLIVCCCFVLIPARSEAASGNDDEDSIELGSTKVVHYKIDNNFRVRGWKLSSEIYLGNTKVNGEWGLGLLVDKGAYVYGLNNSQASFMWRF